MMSIAHGLCGDKSVAESLFAEIGERAKTENVLASYMAMPLAALGHHDRAIDALERAYATKEHEMIFLGVSPIWDPLRAHPRFQALLRKMNFPAAV